MGLLDKLTEKLVVVTPQDRKDSVTYGFNKGRQLEANLEAKAREEAKKDKTRGKYIAKKNKKADKKAHKKWRPL